MVRVWGSKEPRLLREWFQKLKGQNDTLHSPSRHRHLFRRVKSPDIH